MASRTAPGAALGARDVTRCAQHSSGSKASENKHRKPQQQSAKRTRPASASQTVTPPMKVEVEAQLAKLEQAANPWWSTFCGITNGVWLGETAAFAPSTGAAEGLALDQNMKPVLDMHTQVTEERVCEGPQDYVTRRTARAQGQAQLATVGEQIEGQGHDWDEEILSSEEEGLVYFDGGAYSRGPLSLISTAAAVEPSRAVRHEPSAPSDSRPPSSQLHPSQEGDDLAEGEEEGIAAMPDEGWGRAGPPRVVTLEQCLAWGGEQRQRCRVVIAVSGGGDTGEELDISLLRITLFHEYWQGLLHQLDLATLQANSAVSLTPFGSKPNHTGSAAKPTDQPTSLQPSSPAASVAPSDAVSSAQNLNQPAASSSSLAEQGGATSSSSQAAAGAQLVDRLQEPEKQTSTSRSNASPAASPAAAAVVTAGAKLSRGPRLKPKKLSGSWKAFDLTAVPIDETDPSTGMTKKAMVYFSQETKQKWSSSPAEQELAGEQGKIDGGALWLPGNTLLELQMLPMVSRGEVADEVEGMSTSDTGRGLLISFSWLVRPGMMISMQREYDSAGDLMEVRSRSAVEGSWVGGRM